MDIISDRFTEETVTDIDFAFLGEVRALTLREYDTLQELSDRFIIKFNKVVHPETVVFYKDQLRYTVTRTRVIRKPVKTLEDVVTPGN